MTDRILIVEGRFYDDLSDELLNGAKAALDAAGAKYEVATVPGALEIPAVIAIAEKSRAGFDGYVALGVVIRGETYHFEVVSDESARGIMDLANTGLAIGNGVLTVENEEQAWARARASEGDKGGGAARACLAVLGVKQRFTRPRQ
jgi:6,7-dimethyl-8-ribityllumazine synthase